MRAYYLLKWKALGQVWVGPRVRWAPAQQDMVPKSSFDVASSAGFAEPLEEEQKAGSPLGGPRVSKLEEKANQEETVDQIAKKGAGAQAAGGPGEFPWREWAWLVLVW